MRIAAKGNVIVASNQIGVWNQHKDNQSAKRFEDEAYHKIQKSFYHFFEYLETIFEGNQINSIIDLYEKRAEQETVVKEFERKTTFEFLHFMLNNPKLMKNYWKWIIKKIICTKK
jgi:hypothetical protein